MDAELERKLRELVDRQEIHQVMLKYARGLDRLDFELARSCYWGDAIGHIMQYTVHDNTAPDNVWAIPSDIIGPLLAVVLLIAYRRMSWRVPVAA